MANEDLIKQIETMSVLELSELVKALEEKFDVSAASMAAPAAAAVAPEGGAAAAEEKTEFNVFLKATGDQKVPVIKVVKEVTGKGLKDSKDMVDGAPVMVKEGLKKEEAEELKKKFEEAGATVELQ